MICAKLQIIFQKHQKNEFIFLLTNALVYSLLWNQKVICLVSLAF